MCDKSMVSDDLIETRRAIYAQPGFTDTMKRIMCLQEMEIRRPNMITAEQYRSIKAPTMVVWTSHDPTATPEEGKQIADMIPGSKFVVMNRCGHWPQFEDAEQFNRLHIEFLRTGSRFQMNQQTKHGELAARIRAAYAGTPIAPIRPQLAELDVDAAYAIQQENTAHWQAEGRRLVGSKIGLTSRAVQKQLGVDRPDFGVLFADMMVAEDDSSPRRVLQPKIEAEVAFLLDRDVDVEAPTVADVLRATAYVMPALEIVGSRITNWDIAIVDTVADNASSGLYVLGRTHPAPRRAGPARSSDADDEAGRGRFRRERALRVSAIPSTRWLGWPASWTAANARCAPATSCSRVRSVPWFRSVRRPFEATSRN